MVLREEAKLDVDPSGFQKGIRKAGVAFEGLQQDVGRVGGQISTVMQFAAGFGIVAAIQQASAAFTSFIEKVERQGEALGRRAGVAPTGRAAEAFRALGEARGAVVARPFRAGVAGLEASALRAAALVSSIFGGEFARAMEGLADEARETAATLANAGDSLGAAAEQAKKTADKAAQFEARQRQIILPRLVSRALELRIDPTTINEIIKSVKQIGAEEAIKNLMDKIREAGQAAQANP